MSLASEILGRRLRLPEPETREINLEKNLPIPMEDGTVLLANRYFPADGRPRPTILVRSPYGRAGFFGLIYGRLFAERGFQVVVQSVRGTFGSGGEFEPFHERPDGMATVAWVEDQPWFDGRLAMAGASYLGITSWAVAPEAGERLDAIALSVTASQASGPAFGGGAISLETGLAWTMIVASQERRFGAVRLFRQMRGLPDLFDDLPISGLDSQATGRSMSFFAEWIEHAGGDDQYWEPRDFSGGVAGTSAPAQLVGGWFDIFLPWMLRDFVTLQDAGRDPQLVVGPWTHMSSRLLAKSARESLAWLRSKLLDDHRLLAEAPVRVQVNGSMRWREFDTWPPPAEPLLLHLHPGGLLSEEDPVESEPDRFSYDPAFPTPSVGGPGLLANNPVVDNRELEARSDVLTYTTEPLASEIEVIGPVSAAISVRSSLEHFDLFARVCDVHPDGTSLNVCDALERYLPAKASAGPDGVVRMEFELWPTAHQFPVGHRIRLQISSGAHPRYARNPGTGEDPARATRLLTSRQEIHHDPSHRSAVVIPVTRR